ncbi:MAG: hypothetical protein FJ405_07870 [Verrucomicrobia bacterium]|nr:hypothetical protein [Verrucomicrobiota bacterium]
MSLTTHIKTSQAIVFVVFASFYYGSFATENTEDRGLSAGPLFDRLELTLDRGKREEWLGPLYFRQEREEERGWGIPPLITWTTDAGVDSTELDILYPLLTYDRFGTEKQWQLFQWFNFSGGQSIDESTKGRFTLFPFYFQQRSENPTNQYRALVPIYGTLKNRFFRDEVRFVLMPLYAKSRKRDVWTENYLFPFFHLRHGGGVRGWQFWPVTGVERKPVTERVNNWGDTESVPGHQKFFAAWPFFFKERTGIGSTNELRSTAFLPVFSVERSPLRDSTAFPWPLGFRFTEDREKQYREWNAPWPLVVFARGPGKHANRVWPLFSEARTPTKTTGFYLWPVYKSTDIRAAPFERDSFRIFFYAYTQLDDRNVDTGESMKRRAAWPLFFYKKDFQGRSRLQFLAPIEAMLPNNKSMERDWAPVWSIWRGEKNPKTGASSQSLLWNLYRMEKTPASKKCSIMFGLFQYQTGRDGKRTRLFFIPLPKSRPAKQVPTTGTEPSQPVTDVSGTGSTQQR